MNIFNLSGKQALITGGSRGIGFGIAESLASQGVGVTLVARSQESLDKAAKKLSKYNVSINTCSFDVSNTDSIAECFNDLVKKNGNYDILVNSAGTVKRGEAENLSLSDFEEVMRVNVTATFAWAQAFASNCINRQGEGSIINIGSLMSQCSRRMTAAYTASKGAIKMLTKNMAVEWAQFGIRANAIGPGFIKTDFTEPLWTNEEFDAWVKERTPMARWGKPEDIGHVAAFLASPAAAYVTGQILYVDGGLLASL